MSTAIQFEEWRSQSRCDSSTTHLFFPDAENRLAVREARNVCIGCPVFEQCREWAFNNYDTVPYGILAGYSAADRAAIDALILDPYDWREQSWQTLQKRATPAVKSSARERADERWKSSQQAHNVRKHEEAVARKAERDAVKEAAKAEKAEREAVIAARHAEWLAQIRSEEAQRRERLAVIIAEREKLRKEKEWLKQVEQRPACPNGHDKESMYKYRRKGRNEIWCCGKCRAKVVKEEAGA